VPKYLQANDGVLVNIEHVAVVEVSNGAPPRSVKFLSANMNIMGTMAEDVFHTVAHGFINGGPGFVNPAQVAWTQPVTVGPAARGGRSVEAFGATGKSFGRVNVAALEAAIRERK
jgi:hypothetical protein